MFVFKSGFFFLIYWIWAVYIFQILIPYQSSVQFSRSVVSDSLWAHRLQHTRLACPLPTPGACSNPCPSSQWCHPTISSSVVPFSSCLQSFLASGSFQNYLQFFASGGQSIGASASVSVLPMNIQDWFLLRWTGLIFLLSKGLSQESSPTPQFKNINHQCSAFFVVQLSYLYMTARKTIALTRQTFVGKVMSLRFNMLSRFVKCLLILWLQSLSTVILELKKRKSVTVSTFSPSICHEVMGLECHDLSFLNAVLSQLFHSPLSPSSRVSLVPLWFLPLEWYHLHIWGCWYFSWQSWFQLVIHSAWNFAWCSLHIS